MSIFDKFKVNPYISTYAGAPVDAFNQVATNLQARYDKNLADMDQIELQMSAIATMDADKAYKDQLTKEYQDQIEALSAAPESATRGVRQLSKQFQMDERLKTMKTNQAALAQAQEEMKEGDYSDFQVNKFNQALAKYQAVDEDPNSPTYGLSGAAAGRKFIAPNFYEELVPGQVVDERVNGIKAVKEGKATISADGSIVMNDGSATISKERVAESAMGVLADPQMKRQMIDQFMYQFKRPPGKGTTEDGKEFDELQAYFMQEYVDPAIAKYSINSQGQDLSKLRSAYQTRLEELDPAISAPAASLMVGTDLSEELSTQERYDQRVALQDMLANGNYTGYDDILVATNQLNRLDESLKRAMLGTAENPTDLPEALKNAIQGASADELWDLVRKGHASGKTGAISLLDQMLESIDPEADRTGLQYNEKANAIGRSIQNNYGTTMLNRINAATNQRTLWLEATNQLRAERNPDRNNPETIAQRANELREERVAQLRDDINNKYDELIADAGFSNQKAYDFLIKSGLSPEQAAEYQENLQDFVNDTGGLGWSKGYEDIMKDGIMEVATSRNTVSIDSVLDENTKSSLEYAISTQFDTMDIDLSNFEAFTVIGEGKEQQLSTDLADLQKYDWTDLELVGIDATNGAGFVKVVIPPLDTTSDQPLTMAINLATDDFAQARHRIAQEAQANVEALIGTGGDADQIEIQRAVYANFSAPDILKDIKIGLHDNSYDPDQPYLITHGYLSHAFGEAVYPKYTPDGDIIFIGEKSNKHYTQGADNETLAFAQLMKAADRQFGSN